MIPNLTYEQFTDFHKKYYHPSNSYIYLYGDMDFVEKLQWLDEMYLSSFEAMEIDSKIELQQPFAAMKEIEESYRTVYTLGQDVKSGQVITEDMFQLGTAQIQHIPNNATSTLETFVNYSLTDSEGNKLYSDDEGMYLLKDSEYIEVYETENKYYTYSSDGVKEELTGVRKEEL